MQPLLYGWLDTGLPADTTTSSPIADLSDRGADVSFRTGALWGPLTASIRWSGGFDEGIVAARDWLGAPIIILSPDSTWCWEGFVQTVSFGAGRRRRSRSLDGYANRARVEWTSLSGAGGPTIANDTEGQLQYGIIEYEHNGGTLTPTSAITVADQVLAERSHLLWLPEGGSLSGPPSIELRCAGVSRTLGYQVVTVPTWGESDIAYIIQSILVAHCPWVSLDHSNILPTGVLASAMFTGSETCLDVIKRLIGYLPNYTFRIEAGRIAYLQPLNRLNYTEDYIEQIDGSIETTTGGHVPSWALQPDTILRQVDFAGSGPYTTEAIRAIENMFLVETGYDSRENTHSYTAAVAGIEGAIDAI